MALNLKDWGEEIRSIQDYLDKVEKLIENCVLGVIILDGFRPNVLFEFGLLKGKKKPIIILQSENALINIKTLYTSYEESGLTPKYFGMLKNPSINLSSQFSDLGGKHIAYFDWGAEESDKKHPSIVLEGEIKKNRAQINEEFEKVKIRNIRKLWQS